jgi:hypothetical protein
VTPNEALRLLAGLAIAAPVLLAVAWVVLRAKQPLSPRRVPVELKHALAVVLKAGYGVEKDGVHLYPKFKKDFAILKFDKDANLDPAVDELHEDVGVAIDRHLELVAPAEVVNTAWGPLTIG